MKFRFVLIAAALLLSAPAPAQEFSPTLERIKANGVFTIAYRENAPPFSSRNTDGVPVGFSIQLCQEIARDVSVAIRNPAMRIEYVPVDARTRFEVIDKGLADIVCGITSVTMARMEKMDFSFITFVTGARLMVPAGAPYNSIRDIADKPVGVIANTTSERAVRDAARREGVLLRLHQLGHRDDALLAFSRGEIGGFVSDNMVLSKMLQETRYRNRFKLVGGILGYDPYAFIVPKNDSYFRFIVNRRIAQLQRSGKIRQYHDAYFQGIGGEVSALYDYVIAVQSFPQK